LPLPRHDFYGGTYPTPREPLRNALAKAAFEGFSIKYELKEKVIYFYQPLCQCQQSLAHHWQW
jgi:hypothetical protein